MKQQNMNSELSLSVSKNIKRIQVNEAGEYITMNLNDQEFVPRLIRLMKEFEAAADECNEKSSIIDVMPEETQQERMKKIEAAADFKLQICREMKGKVDDAFQDEVCRKVFGHVTPSVAAFAEFFDQIGALLKRFGDEKAEERRRKIAKYTDKYTKEG